MLSYQHGYHAGHFADVVKHLTLTRLLNYLLRKVKPLFYLETHSGRGSYDLQHKQAAKTKEYLQGISILWEQKDKLSPLFKPYIDIISTINPTHELRFYTGSPCLAITMLRAQDRLYCCELHPGEFEHLQQLSRQGKRVFYSNSDGLASINTLLPPIERRGLIFIDPSFEIKSEYKEIPKLIKSAYQRFSTGIFCLWYPLVDKRLHKQLLLGMADIKAGSTLHLEVNFTSPGQIGMTGCGLWIINPPYVLKEEMNHILQELCKLVNSKATFFIS